MLQSLFAPISRVLRAPTTRQFAIALTVCALVVFLVPATAGAQDVFTAADAWMRKAIKIVGYILIIGGLLLMLMGGYGVKEGRGGWPAIAVGVALIFVGFKATGSLSAASDIFG